MKIQYLINLFEISFKKIENFVIIKLIQVQNNEMK